MPAADSTALIVARFLKANGYEQSFAAFVEESGLSESAGDTTSGDMTIERLLDEKRIFDKSISFEKFNLSDEKDDGWRFPAPLQSTKITALPQSVNVLNIAVESSGTSSTLYTTTSDRQIRTISLPSLELTNSFSDLRDAPTLSQVILNNRYHISTAMSGELSISDLRTAKLLHKRKDHSKFAVSVVTHQCSSGTLIATAGWDNKVILYNFESALDDSTTPSLSDPLGVIELTTKPEAILFVEHPELKDPILVITRTDSSHLHFYSTWSPVTMLGKQNLAPYSNTWVAFTPSSIALSPQDAGVIAVATNSTPHMKLLVVTLLLPNPSNEASKGSLTQLEQARAAQVIADRENNAIKLHCNTMSPQTPYSTPLVIWRPHGSGVWVNSDDGLIRGIDTVTGKIVDKLKAHDEGSRVRTLWAGYLKVKHEAPENQEWLISGGFDHNLFVWRANNS